MERGGKVRSPGWFFSLRFRLILAFTLALALALAGVGLFVGFAAEQETNRFQRRSQEFRADRVHRLIARHYREHRDWAGLQPWLEQAANLYGRRLVVTDRSGRIIVDSHDKFALEGAAAATQKREWEAREKTEVFGRSRPIVVDDHQVGVLALAPDNDTAIEGDSNGGGIFPAAFLPAGPAGPPPNREPAAARLAAEVQRSLWWTGLAAAAAGILLVSLMSRRILAPVQRLNAAARRLGQGDLSQRVPAAGPRELQDLSRTFNTMAENLQAAEQQRRSLVADVAHELRTPLSNLQGYLEAVQDGLLAADSTTISALRQQTAHLIALVEDLRLLAQAEAGVLQLHRAPTALGELLGAAVDDFRPRAEGKDLRLTLEVAADTPQLWLDQTRIRQIVGNLLENALLHTPEGGGVAVTAGPAAGGGVVVSVRDSGPGIPAADLPYIFDRFYRVDPSRARASGGVGLGLTIARQLARAHGGDLRVESPAGAGTVFTLILPAVEPPDPEPSESAG